MSSATYSRISLIKRTRLEATSRFTHLRKFQARDAVRLAHALRTNLATELAMAVLVPFSS